MRRSHDLVARYQSLRIPAGWSCLLMIVSEEILESGLAWVFTRIATGL